MPVLLQPSLPHLRSPFIHPRSGLRRHSSCVLLQDPQPQIFFSWNFLLHSCTNKIDSIGNTLGWERREDGGGVTPFRAGGGDTCTTFYLWGYRKRGGVPLLPLQFSVHLLSVLLNSWSMPGTGHCSVCTHSANAVVNSPDPSQVFLQFGGLSTGSNSSW